MFIVYDVFQDDKQEIAKFNELKLANEFAKKRHEEFVVNKAPYSPSVRVEEV